MLYLKLEGARITSEQKGGTTQHCPGGSDGKQFVCNAGDTGSTSGLGRSPEVGNGTHSSILAWKIPWTEESVATVHGVAKSQTISTLVGLGSLHIEGDF